MTYDVGCSFNLNSHYFHLEHFSSNFAGPMLLFERFYKDDRAPQRFYACSACRDRKDCQFFQWEHESVSKIRSKTHKEMTKASRLPYLQATKCLEKLKSGLDEKEAWQLCQTCSMLLLPAEAKEHQGHTLMELKGDDKQRPSNFLMPVEQQKTQAVSCCSVIFLGQCPWFYWEEWIDVWSGRVIILLCCTIGTCWGNKARVTVYLQVSVVGMNKL